MYRHLSLTKQLLTNAIRRAAVSRGKVSVVHRWLCIASAACNFKTNIHCKHDSGVLPNTMGCSSVSKTHCITVYICNFTNKDNTQDLHYTVHVEENTVSYLCWHHTIGTPIVCRLITQACLSAKEMILM